MKLTGNSINGHFQKEISFIQSWPVGVRLNSFSNKCKNDLFKAIKTAKEAI